MSIHLVSPRAHRAVPLLSFLPALLLACSGPEGPAPSVIDPGGTPCAAHELPLPDGRCQAPGLPLDMPCAPAELALSDGRCQPAGVPPEACGAGFVPNDRGGCDATLPEGICPAGQMAVPGESACREVAPCGEGTYGEIPVDDTTELVDQAYAGTDSDGSLERPWRTIQQGVDAAASGAVVAVAAGRYAEDVRLAARPVRLWGRCPQLVELTGAGFEPYTLSISSEAASGSEVHGLAVSGAMGGVLIGRARSVLLDRVSVQDTTQNGIDVFLRASATLRGSLVERNDYVGIFVAGAELTIEASVIRDSQVDASGAFGRGLSIQNDDDTVVRGQLTLRSSLVEHNRDNGLFAQDSDVTVEGSVLRDNLPDGNGEWGRGITVQAHPRTGRPSVLAVRSSLIEQNHDVGVFASGSDATFEATVVRTTQPEPNHTGGRGLNFQGLRDTGELSELTLRSSLIEQNQEFGAFMDGMRATIEGSIVRATQPDIKGFGRGVNCQNAPMQKERGVLVVRSSLIEQNEQIGIYVAGVDATVDASVVRALQVSPASRSGRGIEVEPDDLGAGRGALTLRSSVIEENYDVGLYFSDSDVTVDTSVVRGTKVAPNIDQYGDGIVLFEQSGRSSLQISSTDIANNARAGILFINGAGAFSRIHSHDNRFGLVVVGPAGPTLGEGNVFDSNHEQDQLADGDLAVPNRSVPVP